MISPELIGEFQIAVREEFGAELSIEEAGRVLQDWVAYFDLLAKLDHRIRTSESVSAPIA